MADKIEGRARELIEAPNFAYVGTVRKDGTAEVVPVWVDMEGDNVAVNSAEGRAWPANARRDGRLTLTVPDKENPYEYTSVTGRIVEVDHDDADAHIDRLAKKYLDADSYPFRQEGEQRVKLVVEPERVRIQSP